MTTRATSLTVLAVWTTVAPGRDRATFTRRVAVALGAGAALAVVATRWAFHREPLAQGVGVELTIAILLVALVGLFIGCTAEFSLAERSEFQRVLETMPISRRRVALWTRVPLLAFGALALAVLVPPMAVIVRTGTGDGWLPSVAIATVALLVGLVLSPAVALVAQWIVVPLRMSGLLGGIMILLWGAYAACSALVARAVFEHGVSEAIGPLTWLLGWPAVLGAAIDPTVGSWLVAVTVLVAGAGLSTLALPHLRTTDVLAATDRVVGRLDLQRWSLLGANVARSLRNRRVRAHVVAGLLFVTVIAVWRFGRTGAGEPETAALILALFAAAASTATRGLSGNPATEIVMLTGPAEFARAQLAGALARGLALGLAGGAMLAAASARLDVLATTVVLVSTASVVGALAGAALTPRPGDSVHELAATLTCGLVLTVAGRLADEVAPGAAAYLAVLLITGAGAAAATVILEQHRWAQHVLGATNQPHQPHQPNQPNQPCEEPIR